MVISRYTRTKVLGLNEMYGTSFATIAIRQNINNGNISVTEMVSSEGERLDTIAGSVYGDGRLWWVLAAASSIGWTLQMPPGTRIVIPNLNEVIRFVG